MMKAIRITQYTVWRVILKLVNGVGFCATWNDRILAEVALVERFAAVFFAVDFRATGALAATAFGRRVVVARVDLEATVFLTGAFFVDALFAAGFFVVAMCVPF